MPLAVRVLDEVRRMSDVDADFEDGDFFQWDEAQGKFVGVAVSGASPGGSSGDYQYNNSGAFAGGLLKQGTDQILVPQGTGPSVPGVGFVGQATSGYGFSNGGFSIHVGGAYVAQFTASIVRLINANALTWSSDPVNSNSNTGIARDSDGVVKITDGGNGGGSLKTADPTSGMGPAWKLGSKKAAAVALDTANYVEASVGGVTVKLAIVT